MKMARASSFSTIETNCSDEVYNFTCTLCAKRNKFYQAVNFCFECQEYLCLRCTKSHNSFLLMAGHNLLKAELTSMNNKCSIPYIPTERCTKHPAEIIKMYCAIHDQVACTVCTTIDHKSCNGIQYIPDVVGALYTKQMNTDTITALLKASEKIKTLKEIYNKVLGDLSTARQTTLQTIQKFRQELNHLLDKLEQNTKQQLDDQYQTLQRQWQVLIEKGTAVACNFQKQLDQLQTTESNTSQQFVITKMSKEDISWVNSLIRQLLPSSIQITFSQNEAINSCLKQLSSLGNISYSIVNRKLGLYVVKESHKHNVRIESDSSTCWICGSCILDSGQLLLTDETNNKLKLFDTNKNAVTSYCTMPESPSAVCVVSDVEAAVSMTKGMVQFVSISNGLLPTRILNMDHGCCGLAIAVDKMYITDDDNLYVHELNGKLIRTINKDQSGQNIFSRARHLAVSNNGNIHVADVNNGLITLDTQGQVLWKYTGSDLEGAYGVCTDGCENLFVCGYNSRNALQLEHDGHNLGELFNIKHCVVKPKSVWLDKKNCRLLITYSANDSILTFSLE